MESTSTLGSLGNWYAPEYPESISHTINTMIMQKRTVKTEWKKDLMTEAETVGLQSQC